MKSKGLFKNDKNILKNICSTRMSDVTFVRATSYKHMVLHLSERCRSGEDFLGLIL